MPLPHFRLLFGALLPPLLANLALAINSLMEMIGRSAFTSNRLWGIYTFLGEVGFFLISFDLYLVTELR